MARARVEMRPSYSISPQYAYYPFGGGPRMSNGEGFSIMEERRALAMTAQRFEVQVLHDGTRPGLHASAEGGNVRPIELALGGVPQIRRF
jgi:cytochrome P450